MGGNEAPDRQDDEFDLAQRFFTPKTVRRLLTQYDELLAPWHEDDTPEDSRIIRMGNTKQKPNPEPTIYRLADLKASIDSALAELAVDDREAHHVIVWLYLHRVGWEKTELYTGSTSAGFAERRGVRKMAVFLGYRRDM